jgi:hypothetical protein
MFSRLCITAVVALSLASTLHAAIPALTPELPAAPPVYGPASWSQQLVNVVAAPSSSEFIVSWMDDRHRYDPSTYTSSTLRTTLMRSNGTMEEPYGLVIASNVVQAVMTAIPDGAVVIYSDPTDAWMQRLDASGRPAEARRLLPFRNVWFYALASNGSNLMLATSLPNISGAGRAHILDFTGQELRSELFSQRIEEVTAFTIGTDYQLIQRDIICFAASICATSISETIIKPQGTEQRTIVSDLGDHYRVGAAATENGVTLVAWVSDVPSGNAAAQIVQFVTIGPAGVSAKKEIFRTPTDTISGNSPITVGWDGKNFVISWTAVAQGTTSNLPDEAAIRIAPDGTQLDANPVRFGGGFGAPRFARSNTRYAMVWSGRELLEGPSDLLARTIDSFDEIAATTERNTIDVTRSSRIQRTPAIARLGSGTLSVWAERDAPSSIAGSYLLDGSSTPNTMLFASGTRANSRPAVAVTAGIGLVAWMETRNEGVRIVARRVSPEGMIYYESEIEIASEPRFEWEMGGESVSIAGDGELFLVTWTGSDSQIHAARVVAATGIVLDHPVLVVSRQREPRFGVRGFAQAAWSGSLFLVAWLEDPINPILLSPPLPPVTMVYQSRITSDGVVLDSVESSLLYQGAGSGNSLASTFDGNTLLLTWTQIATTSCVRALPLQQTGILLLPSPVSLRCVTNAFPPLLGNVATASANGSFVVSWDERTGSTTNVMATRVDAFANELDVPWIVATDSHDPALAFRGNLPVFAYAKITSSTSMFGGVARIFERTITGAEQSGRMRPTRR